MIKETIIHREGNFEAIRISGLKKPVGGVISGWQWADAGDIIGVRRVGTPLNTQQPEIGVQIVFSEAGAISAAKENDAYEGVEAD